MQGSADPPARRKNRDDARWRPARKGAGYVEFSYDRNGYLTLRGVVKRRGRRHHADRVPVGYDPTDVRIARAKREAQAKLASLVARLDRHERPDRKREERTLGRQLRLWLGQVEGRMRRERNYRDYERQVEERLLAYPIAHVAMADLQPEDVDAWLADLRWAGATSYQLPSAYGRLLECLRSCDWLADHLERERERGRGCRPDELVFVVHGRPQKGPWRNAAAAPLAYAYTRRKLVELSADAGLPATGKTHLMRVTFGTVAGDESVPAHVLQDLPGHADPRTSLIYTRRRSASVNRATDAVGRALGGTKAAEKAAGGG